MAKFIMAQISSRQEATEKTNEKKGVSLKSVSEYFPEHFLTYEANILRVKVKRKCFWEIGFTNLRRCRRARP